MREKFKLQMNRFNIEFLCLLKGKKVQLQTASKCRKNIQMVEHFAHLVGGLMPYTVPFDQLVNVCRSQSVKRFPYKEIKMRPFSKVIGLKKGKRAMP